MIFSKFFKNKWQHKDANVRIEAINNELDATNDQQVLQQLASEDNAELVREAALLKLADFATWLDAFANNNKTKVQQFAKRQIEQLLFDQQAQQLSQAEKLALLSGPQLANLKQAVSLEKWLNHEQAPELVLALYKQINKPQLLLSTFNQKQNDDIQTALIADIEEIPLLEKLLKKTNSVQVQQVIQQKIDQQTALAELPLKTRKQAQLVLAKLLALKDVADYSQVLAKRPTLTTEWQALQEQLSCLAEEEQQQLSEKFTHINSQLDKLFVKKAEAYQQALIAKQVEQEKQQAKQDIQQGLAEINTQLAEAIFNSDTIEQSQYQQSLTELAQRIEQAPLNEQDQQAFHKQLQQQQATLVQLPQISQALSQATSLIAKMAQFALPEDLSQLNERQAVFNQWLTDYQAAEKQACNMLPDTIKTAFNDIKQQWLAALKPLNKQQKGLLIQTQKKIAEFNRLVSQGKFNACFGLFKKISQLHEQLTEQQQQRIQRDFDRCQEKITELGDWEHYIATPRKAELLSEIQALAQTPRDNPNEQAELVKQYRNKWNLLGHAEDDVEQDLNQAFNDACEQAFAPCRQFYQQQDKLREQHLATRLQIIDHAKHTATLLTEEPRDYKAIDGQLNKLQQRWRNAGEVDRAKYKELNQVFVDIISPVKTAVHEFHQENAEQKQALVTKVQQLASNDDIHQAAEHSKQLQSQWKQIGYSGHSKENKLWKAFRTANDEIFGKLAELKNAEKAALAEQKSEHEQELNQLKQLKQQHGNSLKDLANVVDAAKDLQQRILAEERVDRGQVKAVEKFIQSCEQKITKIKAEQKQQNWQKVFAVLEQLIEPNEDDEPITERPEYNGLSASWQKKIQELLSSNQVADRATKTLELEILAGIDSPAQLKDERLQVQVTLMQDQMLSGHAVDLEGGFNDWLSLGALSTEDANYIARLKPIYC